MYSKLSLSFVIYLVERAFRTKGGGCFLELVDASALGIGSAAVISVFTHVEKHELKIRKVASGTPLSRNFVLLWRRYADLGLRSVFVVRRTLEGLGQARRRRLLFIGC